MASRLPRICIFHAAQVIEVRGCARLVPGFS